MFNGKSMCYGQLAIKVTKNAVILHYNFSLSDCHFSQIFLEGDVTSPYMMYDVQFCDLFLKQNQNIN